MEDSLVYMDASVRALPCGTYLMVDVDALLANPKVREESRFLTT